uniref:NADP-dependent oxidoreductase domain-containing protein n=1 Tax=Acrobeloides nanus TaxID=290746 RepID=A0A914C670_9BILA
TIGFNAQGPDPTQCKPALIPHIDTWRVLEKYYKLGKFKAIGISNFNQKQIQDLYDQAEIKPHNLQVECHILLPQKELFEFAKKLGISFTSYATMGSPGRPSKNPDEPNPTEVPLVVELAKKYNKTPSQILLRQMIQRGIAVIPKSTNPERLRQNSDIFDFELTQEDLTKFNEIKLHKWLFQSFWESFAKHHPYFPFNGY